METELSAICFAETDEMLVQVNVRALSFLAGREPDQVLRSVAKMVSKLARHEEIKYVDSAGNPKWIVAYRPLISEFEHTDECNAAFAEWLEARSDWVRRHPKACPYCFGRGFHVSRYDLSSAGVSLSPGYMEDIEPCLHCEGQETKPVCALCGAELAGPDGYERVCGCANDPYPEEPECFCHEELGEVLETEQALQAFQQEIAAWEAAGKTFQDLLGEALSEDESDA